MYIAILRDKQLMLYYVFDSLESQSKREPTRMLFH